jgi:transcriptional regulator with XRE-family HTH domain
MIGERIRAARKAQRLSLRALAERVGLSHEMIRRYEQGKATPDGATLIKIADALERNLDYFFRPALVGEIKPVFRTKHKMPRTPTLSTPRRSSGLARALHPHRGDTEA